jgi:hypothetical protein
LENEGQMTGRCGCAPADLFKAAREIFEKSENDDGEKRMMDGSHNETSLSFLYWSSGMKRKHEHECNSV